MHTVENAVIIPLFTVIIIALISVSGYMYDKTVMRDIMRQTSIEYTSCIKEDERKELLAKSKNYIKDKTIFIKNIKINEEVDSKGTGEIICSAEWPIQIGLFGIKVDSMQIRQKVNNNRAEELIRKAKVILEVNG